MEAFGSSGYGRLPSRFDQTELLTTMEEKKQDQSQLWISMEIQLNDICLVDQCFSVRGWLNGFWMDECLAKRIKNQSNGSIQGEEKNLPFTSNCFHNGSDINHVTPPKLSVYDDNKNIVQVAYDLTATIHKRFDVATFPFDPQFLDIKFVYRKKKFYLDLSPSVVKEWNLKGAYHFDRPLQVVMQDNLTEYRLETPWVDFRKSIPSFNENGKEYNFNFSLLRLRVQRYPGYYLTYIVFPLWLIVNLACCTLAMSVDNVEGRLNFLVTLLLTIAAFQYAVSASLPNSSEITVIDKYILAAYSIMSILIIHVSIVGSVLVDKDDEYEKVGRRIILYDTAITFSLTLLWSIYTGYLILWRYRTYRQVDWEELSDKIMAKWDKQRNEKGGSRFKFAQTDRIFDTYYGEQSFEQ